MKNEEQIIRQLILSWTDAISKNDREGILRFHSKDILMYDFPCEVRGIDGYNKTWDFFYKEQIGAIHFVARDIEVTASDSVAFATCLIRCEGTSAGIVELRLTMGLKKIDRDWIIMHEHHSVPSTDSRFIDEKK